LIDITGRTFYQIKNSVVLSSKGGEHYVQILRMQTGQKSQKDQEIEEQKITRMVHTEKTRGHAIVAWLLVFLR